MCQGASFVVLVLIVLLYACPGAAFVPALMVSAGNGRGHDCISSTAGPRISMKMPTHMQGTAGSEKAHGAKLLQAATVPRQPIATPSLRSAGAILGHACLVMMLLFASAPTAEAKGGGGGGGGGGGRRSRSSASTRSYRSSSSDPEKEWKDRTADEKAVIVGEFAIPVLIQMARGIHHARERAEWRQARKVWVRAGSNLSPMANQLQSGTYTAEYTERGKVKRCTYDLRFTSVTSDRESPFSGTVRGYGSDADGEFMIDGGVFDRSTGRVAWGEYSTRGSLYTEVELKCEGGAKMRGSYRSNLGLAGRLKVSPKN